MVACPNGWQPLAWKGTTIPAAHGSTGAVATETTTMWWLWPVIFLVQGVTLATQQDHLLTYGSPKETLLTLEGGDKSSARVSRQRFKRFLTFNNDRSNIRVEMVFAIPVLHIPIGGNPVPGPYGTGVSPVVDVNAKSVIAASVVLFTLFFVIPKLVRIFLPTFPQSRALEESGVTRVMEGVESTFNVSTTACWQQYVCSLVQEGKQDTTSNMAKILDGIANMKWVEQLTAGTSFGEAMASGKSDDHGCKTFFAQCPLSSDKLGTFAKQVARQYINHLINVSNANNHK